MVLGKRLRRGSVAGMKAEVSFVDILLSVWVSTVDEVFEGILATFQTEEHEASRSLYCR